MILMEEILFLADAFTDRVNQVNRDPGSDTRNVLLGATVVLIVGGALFVWVYFRSRSKSHGQDRERLSQMGKSIRPEAGSSSEIGKSSSKRRRRKRRRVREHRPRNPTLDKIGGLPPPRPDDQLPKY